MRRPCLVMGVAATCVFAMAGPARAQLWPGYGYGYGGWGGAPGAAALMSSGYRDATQATLKAQSRQLGQMRTMEQNMVVQSGIRNTLSNQAASRTEAIAGQRQANQDWWFQNQSQQMAADRAAMRGRGGAPAVGFEPGAAAAAPVEAATDVIKWPTLLQESAFAYQRAQIEAPYRRSPPGLSVPTPDDYRAMIKTVADMRAVLEWLTQQGDDTDDYDEAKAFLNKIDQAARERAAAAPTPTKG